ncbi:MAG: hypothetical protein ACMXYD_02555 [Candidatus Woesearchaeota archaeon]
MRLANQELYGYIAHPGIGSYTYPKQFDSSKGIYSSPINLLSQKESTIWSYSNRIIFDQPGDYPIYRLFNQEHNFSEYSTHYIHIEPVSVWLKIEQNRRIFSLTLMMIALTLFSISSRQASKNN